MGGALMGWLFVAPLRFTSSRRCRIWSRSALGGRGNWFTARLALFWSFWPRRP
jgi:hypothetical protein